MSSDEITTYLNSGEHSESIDDAIQYARDKYNDYSDDAEYYSGKIFGRNKAKKSREQAEKWDSVYKKLTGQDFDTEQESQIDQDDQENIDAVYEIIEEP
jgi:hypothetical protein